MRKGILFICFILLFPVIVGCSQDARVDGSSIESFQQSMDTVSASLSKDEQMQFVEAYMKIVSSIDLGDLSSQDEARQKSLDAMRKELDGMTFSQVIALGNTFEASPEITQAMTDMKTMGTNSDYQHDADIVRLKHLKYFGAIIEEYKQKTGSYPLQDNSELQHYVHITSSHQKQYAQQRPPYEHNYSEPEALVAVLEEGLGRSIDLPFDPQLVPANKPNFYIYMTQDDRFFFSVHLHDGEGVGRQIGPYYYKAEISNIAIPAEQIFTYDELLKNELFLNRVNEKYASNPPVNPEQKDLGSDL